MTSIFGYARSLAATGLTGTAKLLRVGASALGGAASLLRPGALDDERGEPRKRAPKPRMEPDEPASGFADADHPGAGVAAVTDAREAEADSQEADADGVDAEDVRPPGAVSEPPQVATQEVTHASSAPTHVAELARGTVSEVTSALDALSTDELRMLLEHETTHRNRKGVLDAIEQVLTS